MRALKQLYNEDGTLNYKSVGLLDHLSEEEFSAIKHGVHVSCVDKGNIIFEHGNLPSQMYIVYHGFIKVMKYMSDGKEQILYIYQDDDFIGGHNILSQENYIYNAYALIRTTMVTLSAEIVRGSLIRDPRFLLKVLDKSFDRVRKAEDLLDRLFVSNADLKVAKMLISLIKLYGSVDGGQVIIDFDLTQEELGAFAGLARETMSRKLNQFEQEGIIEQVSRGKIIIKDPSALADLLY